MAKKQEKKKKRKRLRVGRLLLLLILLGGIGYLLYRYVNIPILSIKVTGNNILTDQEIIEQADLEDYDSFFSSVTLVIKNKLKKNFYIKDAKVTKGFLSIKIKVIEDKVLYINKDTGEKVSLTGKKKDDKELCVPYLSNVVPDKKIKGFNKAMSKIDDEILCKMSEIKYDPNDIDKDRYFVYMDDGNSVYLTVNKFKKINNYNTILENVGKQNGILYLDYGDYFKAY